MKRFLSAILAVVMVCTLTFGTTSVAEAKEEPIIVDGSVLTDEESSIVTVEPLTRGLYLKSGSSTIVEAGSGKIAVGGDTVGQKVVSKIAVYVRVQRLVGGSWAAYTSWSATKTNAAYVGTSKTYTVPKGYYYRVYCTHTAESDVSGSYTNGLYID